MASGKSGLDDAGRQRDAAVADALDEAGRVLIRLAARLRAAAAGTAPATTSPATAATTTPPPGRRIRAPQLGERQARVLDLGGLDQPEGLAASDVATATGYSASNATNILKRLAELGYLEPVRNERPARWRRRGS